MGVLRPTTLQAITVEFEVTEALDGITPSPVVNIDQGSPDPTPFDLLSQVYRPSPVERLGLIDPDLLLGGSIGPRCIPFVTLDTDALGGPAAALDLVAVRLGSPNEVVFQKQIADLAGVAGPVFLDEGFNVPQGSDLRFSGYLAAPGTPIRVRVSVVVPTSCLDLAAFTPTPSQAGAGPLGFGNGSVGSDTAPRVLSPWYSAGIATTDLTTNARIPITRNGTLRNLFVRHGGPAGNAGVIVYEVRVNGVVPVGTLSVSLASTGLAGFDVTNAIPVNAGDTVDILITKAADIAASPTGVTAGLELAA